MTTFCQPTAVGNGIIESDTSSRYRGRSHQLPFGPKAKAAATSSPRHHMKPYTDSHSISPSSRTSRPLVNTRSHLPRRNSYSQGINVNKLQPPPPRRLSQNAQAVETASASSSSPPRSPPYGVSTTLSPLRPAQCASIHEQSMEDAATSQLRKLCMDIIQSANEGTSPPERAKIKEAVVQYHRSRNSAISPRDPNFTEIPGEFSKVLTYGIARSQTVPQQLPTTTEESSDQLLRTDTNQEAVAKSRARRSRFSEIKDEGEGQLINESRLNTTVEVGPNDDAISCISLPSVVDHS